MKKLFSLITLMVFLVSCGGTKSYKIDGNIAIDGLKDGDTISLGYTKDGAEYTPEAYAVIKDGKFNFAGNTENCKFYFLVNHLTEEPLAIVFLEGGNISADINNEKSVISGTTSNDLFTQFQEEFSAKVMQLQEKQMLLYLDTTLTEEQREGIVKELETLSEEASNTAKEFINNNIETMPALFMLVQFANMFENEELNALIEKIPEENKDSENNCFFSTLLQIQEQRNNPQDFSDYFNALEENADSTAAAE